MSVVLHVVDRLTGGVPIAVRDYIRNSPDGYTHVLLSPFVSNEPAPVWGSIEVTHVDLGRSPFGRLTTILQTIRALSPSVIHAHSSFPGTLTRLIVGVRVPIIYSPHCFKFDDPSIPSALRAAFRLVEVILAYRTSAFGVLSAHEADLARSLRSGVDIVRLPNVASVPPRSANVAPSGRRVGMIGRVAPQKSPEFMVAIADELRARGSDVEFVWIGGGSANAEQLLRDAGVRVTGWLDETDLLAEIDALDLYVHTARYEGFPLSLLDVAARGVPIVARRIPALEEVGLRTFDTVAQGAECIIQGCASVDFRMDLTSRGRRMLSVMNSRTQRDSLRALWSVGG